MQKSRIWKGILKDFWNKNEADKGLRGALQRPEGTEGDHVGSTVVSVSLTLFQCSLGNETERLLTVMKSRSPKVHRRRMHFRRSSRLSALAVRSDEKKK